jgi:uncharacterized RDD family membrane protein YckC
MRTIIIPTSQNIELEYPVAELVDRSIARIIDIVIQAGYGVLVFYGAAEFHVTFSTATTLILALPIVLYTFVLEIIYKGQTFGKKIRNLRVIKQNGDSPSIVEYFMRWLFLIVEGPLVFYTIGFVLMSATKKGQRIGDLVAGTTVIKEELITDFDDTIFREINENYQVRFPEIEGLSDRDIAILKEVLDAGMRSKNADIIARLANKIKDVLGISSDLSDESFLEIVLQDYNYLYGRE